MKAYFRYMPYALCVIQAAVPVLRVVFHVLGWRAVPVPAFGIAITVGALISVIMVIANDHMFDPDTAGKIFSNLAIVLGFFGSAVMLDAGGVLYTILAVMNTVCCLVLSWYVSSSRLLRFMYGFSICMVIFAAVGLLLFSDYGYADYDVVSKYDSPDGRYTAEIIDVDDKIEGAQVRVRKNTVLGIPVSGIFDITMQLTNASGDSVPGRFVVEWVDDDVLSINGYADELN